MSSERFEELEDDVISVLKYPSTLSTRDIDRIGRQIAEMEQEVQMAPPEYSVGMKSRLAGYRSQLVAARQHVAALHRATTATATSDQSRRVVQQAMAALQNTNDSITRSQQLSADTDNVGSTIVNDLGGQREALERTRQRLVETDEDLSQSQRLLRTLRVRVLANKILLIGIIVLEVVVILAGLIVKFVT